MIFHINLIIKYLRVNKKFQLIIIFYFIILFGTFEFQSLFYLFLRYHLNIFSFVFNFPLFNQIQNSLKLVNNHRNKNLLFFNNINVGFYSSLKILCNLFLVFIKIHFFHFNFFFIVFFKCIIHLIILFYSFLHLILINYVLIIHPIINFNYILILANILIIKLLLQKHDNYNQNLFFNNISNLFIFF